MDAQLVHLAQWCAIGLQPLHPVRPDRHDGQRRRNGLARLDGRPMRGTRVHKVVQVLDLQLPIGAAELTEAARPPTSISPPGARSTRSSRLLRM